MVKNLPAMQETRVWSLNWEDSLRREWWTHSSILDWRIPWTEDPGLLNSWRAPSLRQKGLIKEYMQMHVFKAQKVVCLFSISFSDCLSVQLLRCVWLIATPWTAACQASLSITNSWSLLKLMSIELVVPSNHLILCHPHFLPPSVFPSVRVFQMSQFFAWGGQSIGVSASASVLPVNIQDWFPLGWTGWVSFAVQGTLKSLLQHHSSKASFFSAQLSL